MTMQPATRPRARRLGVKKPESAAPPNAKPVATRLDLADLDDMLGYHLRRAQVAVFADFMTTVASCKLKPAEFSILLLIQANPGRKQADIAAVLGIKRPNFVVVLSRLLKRGLVAQQQAEGDRRSSALFLTERGLGLLTRARALLDAHEARVTQRIGALDRGLLINALKSIAKG